jgi:hypothetical protein
MRMLAFDNNIRSGSFLELFSFSINPKGTACFPAVSLRYARHYFCSVQNIFRIYRNFKSGVQSCEWYSYVVRTIGRSFEGTYNVDLQCQRVSHVRNKKNAGNSCSLAFDHKLEFTSATQLEVAPSCLLYRSGFGSVRLNVSESS